MKWKNGCCTRQKEVKSMPSYMSWLWLQGMGGKRREPYKKLDVMTDDRRMEIVHDIRRNYRLPRGGSNVGEMIAGAMARATSFYYFL